MQTFEGLVYVSTGCCCCPGPVDVEVCCVVHHAGTISGCRTQCFGLRLPLNLSHWNKNTRCNNHGLAMMTVRNMAINSVIQQ